MASAKAMNELERMKKESLAQRKIIKNALISCNIRSIPKNFKHFATASETREAEVMCLQETWLDPLSSQENLLEIQGWSQHNNSVGRGKGITTFYKDKYVWEKDVTKPNYQITKIKSDTRDIINVYKSAGAEDNNFLENLCALVSSGKPTTILGDFNICYISERSNRVFQALSNMGFKQIVEFPTHIEGRLIDLVFIYSPDPNISYEVQQKAQYYTDHDLITVF